jgi:saccharopine dehydrogenase-like NADP-dependent oxidoreductase
MTNIYVLGVGRVGSAIALDLSDSFQVTTVDQNNSALSQIQLINSKIRTLHADVKEIRFMDVLREADLVINAMPGYLGFNTLKKIIEAKKNVVDISFFPEDPFELDELAKKNNTTAIVDCGLAPGMGNIIAGRYNKLFNVQRYECMVGGLPEKRSWPWQYKAVFSPIDVIEEYIRPARFMYGGKLVVREALSDPELIDFDEIGTLEAFNTDGLRTMIRTMDIPDMIEKTLRYPGTIEYLRVLKSGGFLSNDPIDYDGKQIRPIDITSKILLPQWKLESGERDLTVMKIRIQYLDENGSPGTVIYSLFDRYDERNKILSMARTTGYTCSAVSHIVIDGKITEKGLLPPEKIGENEKHFEFVMNYLKQRNVIYRIERFNNINK